MAMEVDNQSKQSGIFVKGENESSLELESPYGPWMLVRRSHHKQFSSRTLQKDNGDFKPAS